MSATIIPLRRPSGAVTGGTPIDDLGATLSAAERAGAAGLVEVQRSQAELRRRQDELLSMLEDLRRQDLSAQQDLHHIRSELEMAASLAPAEIALLTRRAEELCRRLEAEGKPSQPR